MVPELLKMGPQELAAFNEDANNNAIVNSAWYDQNNGMAIDLGVTALTLRGNAAESVRIIDIRVMKQCQRPVRGTFFQGYTQGSGDAVKIGFDLDAADPVAQDMAVTSARGLFPLGTRFFDAKTIVLKPGETHTLSIGAFTERHACSFGLRLFVAGAQCITYQDVTYNGMPFRVTAQVPPTMSGRPLSGYRGSYIYSVNSKGAEGKWVEVNPRTYRKK